MKVFFDTNILLDVLARRQPFYADSSTVWSFAEDSRIEGLVSAISFTNIFYVLRKRSDASNARRVLIKLRDAFSVIGCDARVLTMALDSNIKDFEDAVQYFSAVQSGAICLLSRNPRDFPRSSDCPVLTPAEFLASHAFD